MDPEEAPVWVLNVPAAQGRHAEEEVAEKVPAGQLKHKVAPLLLYDPAEQGWQVAAEVAPTAAEKVPCANA